MKIEKGETRDECYAALTGLGCFLVLDTQGVALGCCISAFQAGLLYVSLSGCMKLKSDGLKPILN